MRVTTAVVERGPGEYVGEIAEVGAQAEGDWQIGDKVCALPFIACGHCLPCAAGRFFECQDKKVAGVDAPGGYAEFVATGAQETIRLRRPGSENGCHACYSS